MEMGLAGNGEWGMENGDWGEGMGLLHFAMQHWRYKR